MPGKYLSEFDKGQIQAMRNMGSSIKQIAQTLGRNRKTIGNYLKKANQLPPGEFPKAAPKSGRPRKITEHGQLIMKKAFQTSPRKPCKSLKIEHPDLFGHVSRKSLSTYCIRDLNMPSRVARKKPLLTLVHMQKRLAFASYEQSNPSVCSTQSKFSNVIIFFLPFTGVLHTFEGGGFNHDLTRKSPLQFK